MSQTPAAQAAMAAASGEATGVGEGTVDGVWAGVADDSGVPVDAGAVLELPAGDGVAAVAVGVAVAGVGDDGATVGVPLAHAATRPHRTTAARTALVCFMAGV